jgi:rod shape-determining protein MreD
VTDVLKIALLVVVTALVQATVFSSLTVADGTPDVLLLVLLGVALMRGSVAGSVAGFGGGLLLDVLQLGTMGVVALTLALAGYWAGRYGETTGRDRAHAPLVSVFAITVLVALGGYALHFVLGDTVDARRALGETLLPSLGLNLVLAAPVFAVCRAFLGEGPAGSRVQEVQLLG